MNVGLRNQGPEIPCQEVHVHSSKEFLFPPKQVHVPPGTLEDLKESKMTKYLGSFYQLQGGEGPQLTFSPLMPAGPTGPGGPYVIESHS